jgi:hypothetical protein
MYIDPSQKPTTNSVRKAAVDADFLDELGFKLMIVSTLREITRRRFLRGLYASAVSFLCLFATQIFRIL